MAYNCQRRLFESKIIHYSSFDPFPLNIFMQYKICMADREAFFWNDSGIKTVEMAGSSIFNFLQDTAG
jgi:hypothetical protein